MMSLHTLGLVGGSTNFYAYAQNSPLMLKNPSGQILRLPQLPVLLTSLLTRSASDAVESVAFDIASSIAEGKSQTLNGKL